MSGAAPISWLVYMAMELWRPGTTLATFGIAWVDVTDSRRFLMGTGGKGEKRCWRVSPGGRGAVDSIRCVGAVMAPSLISATTRGVAHGCRGGAAGGV